MYETIGFLSNINRSVQCTIKIVIWLLLIDIIKQSRCNCFFEKPQKILNRKYFVCCSTRNLCSLELEIPEYISACFNKRNYLFTIQYLCYQMQTLHRLTCWRFIGWRQCMLFRATRLVRAGETKLRLKKRRLPLHFQTQSQ